MVFALLCITFVSGAQSQTINQKLITGIPQLNGTVDAYSLKYDPATGGWVYGAYDTVISKYKIISPKGTSGDYTYINSYNGLFDSEGNSYITASVNVTDTVYKYSILKNSEVLSTYDFISDGWVIKDNVIYYAAQDAGMYYFVTYDTKTGVTNKSKGYEDLRLAYIPDGGFSEGEPMGYVGFTKSGKPYYIARSAGESFLVIGGDEQKHYSDITWYDLKFNDMDEPCYIARSQGKFYEERGNTFVVKGTQEYKQFDWVYGPLLFDNSGSPVYVGQDSTGEYKYRSTIMKGGEVVSSIGGNIYTYMFTPQGKLAYISSTEIIGNDGESVWQSYIVIDGKKSKEYSSINSPVFSSNGTVLFTASDKNGKYFVVKNDEVISEKYDYIADARFLTNGMLSYVCTKYGNYEKHISDKSYVFLGDEKNGPYNVINAADWKTNAQVLSDNKGNYAYMAGELVDPVNYTYKYAVYSNKGESKQFDNVSDLKYINGKLCYFAGNMKKKDTYIYDYTLYVDNKKLGDTYSAYTDIAVSSAGVMTFIASKGNDMYLVEVKP